MQNINDLIADEINVKSAQVEAAIKLLDEGSTVPFISRYRKEATGGLTDTDLRTLEERLYYLREMAERRTAILKSITEQEKLTPELEKAIQEADTKTRLEDLYLPYKPKRRTKGQTAKEAGLEPLADLLFKDPSVDPAKEAEKYINAEKKVADVKAALDGAKYILMERFCENAELLAELRQEMWDHGQITSLCQEGKEKEGTKFRDYFEFSELVKKIPSHRSLAVFRGRKTGILQVKLEIKAQDDSDTCPCQALIAKHAQVEHQGRPADDWLAEVVRWTWRVKLNAQIENDILKQIREEAELEAIRVFAKNLKDLLMAAPAGQRPTLALDPGLRTGVKVVALDPTGQLISHDTIFPHAPKKKWDESIQTLYQLCKKHNIELVSIGNGTASRETDQLVSELIKKHDDLNLQKITVSEAGASIYSASEYAAREFPDLDVSFRGAASIGRRLQDPLAELVKIEPKAIGVGQYQHDVSQVKLARGLDSVVEDCVNAVGVDVNTASIPLLSRIAGLNNTIATNIVRFRDKNGLFKTRSALKEVPRFGDRTFEQSAGFLRIVNGESALDSSGVHPEAYSVVEKISSKSDRSITALMADAEFLKSIKAEDYADEQFGIPTITDILQELEKPGRDPRPSFAAVKFDDNIHHVKDLKPGMLLEGVITNVTNFGAFVDIGVHQDGLVHISVISDQFVKNPADVVKTGDIVKVKVMEVDEDRNRISLSMRLNDKPANKSAGTRQNSSNRNDSSSNRASNNRSSNHNASRGQRSMGSQPAPKSTLAGAFANAKKLKPKK